jgi:hypothetical protein
VRKNETTILVDRKILAVILILFLINTVLVAAGFYLLNNRFAPSAEEFAQQQRVAKELVEYNRRLARSLGVDTRSTVHEALSRFNYEIELATNLDDLNKAILANGSRTQERILNEYDVKLRETVLTVINQDASINKLPEKVRITVQLLRDQGILVEPANMLQEETMIKIAENISLPELAHDLVVEVEVEEGRGRLLTPYNPQETIRSLTREVDSLRVSLHELRSRAGHAEMNGPGIIVRIFDADNGYTNDTIIHEADVRDTVNELYAAGAQGISVGNQRLTVNTAIRCVGPSILVNDERIAVNPVVIRAVGDPDVLASGLDIIRISLEVSRNLNFEIEKVDNLTLPAYAR